MLSRNQKHKEAIAQKRTKKKKPKKKKKIAICRKFFPVQTANVA
jgi:hypothetical protein